MMWSSKSQWIPVFAFAILVILIPMALFAVEPMVSDEFMMDEPVYIAAIDDQSDQEIACNSSFCLVVWHDQRGGPYVYDVYGTRIAPDGTVLDPTGIRIGPGGQKPDIATDGENFLVVWSWKPDCYGDNNILGIFLGPDAQPLTGEVITICENTSHNMTPQVAYAGGQYLVAWRDFRNDPEWDNVDLYATLVAPDGTVSDTQGFPLATEAEWENQHEIASDGANFFVVWNRGVIGDWHSDLYAARINPAGQILDAPPLQLTDRNVVDSSPRIAFNGDMFFILFNEYSGGADDVVGIRVLPDGTVLDPDGLSIAAYPDRQAIGSVASDGADFLVTWTDAQFYNDDVEDPCYDYFSMAARIDPDGNILDWEEGYEGKRLLNLNNQYIGAALPIFDQTNYLLIWIGNISGTGHSIFAQRYTPSLESLDDDLYCIAYTANTQEYPTVRYGGGNFLVAWEDYRNGLMGNSIDLYGVRVNPSRNVLDPLGLPIATSRDQQEDAAIGFDGDQYLAIWTDRRSIYPGPYFDIQGIHVGTDGSLPDLNPIQIYGLPQEPNRSDIAFDGVNYLIAWEDRGGDYPGIYANRITPGGTLIDTDPIVLYNYENPGGSYDAYWVETEFCNGVYLVVWNQYTELLDTPVLFAKRVGPDGDILDSEAFRISPSLFDKQGLSDIACDGQNFFVVWEDYGILNNSDIHGQRVTPDGTLLDGQDLIITQAMHHQFHPNVAFNGQNFMVVWDDYRNSPDDWAEGTNSDIYAARVNPAGQLVDTDAIQLTDSTDPDKDPDVDCDQNGQCMVVYQSYVDETLDNGLRIRGRWIIDPTTTTSTTTTTVESTTTSTIPPMDDDADDDVNDDANDDAGLDLDDDETGDNADDDANDDDSSRCGI